ncbi:hypothetical protein [Vibrio tritonius]|uniref:hypothetical protein n=1 Tax=Vibrio tritonius TaxID=1435069 RepID=UPI000B0608F8|nr:hypothetical protein [Vibrio tritonius]
MQTSELHQRAQVKLNDGRNGHSLSTSLGAEMGLLMSSYAALPIFYVEYYVFKYNYVFKSVPCL